MKTSAVPRGRVAPAPAIASGVTVPPATSTASLCSRCASLRVDERDRDTLGVAMPRSEILLVVRFAPFTRRGFEVHALGPRERVFRKLVRGRQRIVTARLPLGAQEAVLGVSAAALAGRPVPLEELWGDAASRRLFERLGDARTSLDTVAILDRAINERLTLARGPRAHAELAVRAAARLAVASVSEVATALRVSERNLRRVFRDTVGVGPKTFARLERFRRALDAARAQEAPSWAAIALDAGYYDQAHLIADFRAIAGVTPQALLGEMRVGVSIG
jgi:AraC-like DNA-binding protein